MCKQKGNKEGGLEGTVRHACSRSAAWNSWPLTAESNPFTFTPAISFVVNCGTQEEIDRLWDGLSEGDAKLQCGRLRDRYGISWQITPRGAGRDDGGPFESGEGYGSPSKDGEAGYSRAQAGIRRINNRMGSGGDCFLHADPLPFPRD